MFILKLKTGEMYQIQDESQLKTAVTGFRQQGVKGNIYRCWGRSRTICGSFLIL
ncbi:MAG: hypothetical protein IMZ43_06515 [Thermoplasmata archaeon]|nr:hypothetical protein [Thermoplasmata archaeon]